MPNRWYPDRRSRLVYRRTNSARRCWTRPAACRRCRRCHVPMDARCRRCRGCRLRVRLAVRCRVCRQRLIHVTSRVASSHHRRRAHPRTKCAGRERAQAAASRSPRKCRTCRTRARAAALCLQSQGLRMCVRRQAPQPAGSRRFRPYRHLRPRRSLRSRPDPELSRAHLSAPTGPPLRCVISRRARPSRSRTSLN